MNPTLLVIIVSVLSIVVLAAALYIMYQQRWQIQMLSAANQGALETISDLQRRQSHKRTRRQEFIGALSRENEALKSLRCYVWHESLDPKQAFSVMVLATDEAEARVQARALYVRRRTLVRLSPSMSPISEAVALKEAQVLYAGTPHVRNPRKYDCAFILNLPQV